jgi:hypothetical protein
VPRIKLLAVKPQPAVSSLTSPLEQSDPQSQAAPPPIPETPRPEISTPQAKPLQTSVEEVAPATAVTPVWPDPPIAAPAPQDPAVPTDAEMKSAQIQADSQATSETVDSARLSDNHSIANAGIVASLISVPITIFPVAVVGLVVVGFLLKFLLGLWVAHRQRIIIDRDDLNWADNPPEHECRDDQSVQQQLEATDCLESPLVPTRIDSGSLVSRRIGGPQPARTPAREKSRDGRSGAQQPHETASLNPVESNLIKTVQPHWHEDQQQYGSVKEADELIDRLHTSQMPRDSDYSRDELADGGCEVHRKHGGAQKSQQIREREEVLETLRRDLGRLLGSANIT